MSSVSSPIEDDKSTAVSSAENLHGYLTGATAFLIWGILPLYWNLVHAVPASETLAHRIFWSLSFVLVLVYWRGQLSQFRAALRSKRVVPTSALCALTIGFNWWIFIRETRKASIA